MNKLYLFLTLLGFVNVVIFVVGIYIMQEFKDFKELCSIWISSQKLDQDLYKLLLNQYKDMAERYDSQKALLSTMCEQYEAITDQYKSISKMQNEYRQLCKECIDRQSDTYEQFKLCNDKLNEIYTPKELLKDNFFYEIAPTNDEPIGGISR